MPDKINIVSKDDVQIIDYKSLLKIVVGIGKNDKQYRRLVVADRAFDKPTIRQAMRDGVPIQDIRENAGWTDDDL